MSLPNRVTGVMRLYTISNIFLKTYMQKSKMDCICDTARIKTQRFFFERVKYMKYLHPVISFSVIYENL